MNRIEEIYYNKTTKYTSKWSNYFDIYDTWFSKFVDKNPFVLEIGVDNGGSLQMWNEYFGKDCYLYGIDNRPKFDYNNTEEYLGFYAKLFVGDQGDQDFLNLVNDYVGGNHKGNIENTFDIVIDDGSHWMWHQILTFETLFPKMREGGIYLVEDTHSSYMNIFGGKYKQPHTFIEYCKNIIDVLHMDHFESTTDFPWTRHIKSIHFYDSVVVIEKGLRPKNSVTFANREKAM